MARRFSWCTVVALVVLLFVTTEGLRERNAQVEDHKTQGATNRGNQRFNSKSLEEPTASTAPKSRSSGDRSPNFERHNEGTTLKPLINPDTKIESSSRSYFNTRTIERSSSPAVTDETATEPAQNKKLEPTNRRNGKINFPRHTERSRVTTEATKEISRRISNRKFNNSDVTKQLDNKGPSVFTATTEYSRSRTGRKIQTSYSTRDLKTQIPTSRRFNNKRFDDVEATTAAFRRNEGRAKPTTEKTERSRSSRLKVNHKEGNSISRRGQDSVLSESESVRVDIPLVVEGTENPVTDVPGFASSERQDINRRTDTRDTSRANSRTGSDRSKTRGKSGEPESTTLGSRNSSRRGSSRYTESTTTESNEQTVSPKRNTVSRDRSRSSDAKKSSAAESRNRSRVRNIDNNLKTTSASTTERDVTRKLVGDRSSPERKARILETGSRPDNRAQEQDGRGRSRSRSRLDVTTPVASDVATTVASDTIQSNDVTSTEAQALTTTTRPTTQATTTTNSRTTTTSRPSSTSTVASEGGRGRGRNRGNQARKQAKEDFFNHGLGFRGRKVPPEGSNVGDSRKNGTVKNDTQYHGNPGWTLRRRPGHSNISEEPSKTVVPSPTDQTNEVVPSNEQSTSTEVTSTVESVTSTTRRGFKKQQTAEESTTVAGTTTKSFRRGNKTFEKNRTVGVGKASTEPAESDNYPPEFKARLTQSKSTNTKISGTKTTPRTPLEDQPKNMFGRRSGSNSMAFTLDDLETAASGNVFLTDESLDTSTLTLINSTGVRRVKKSSSALFAERSRMKLELARRLVKPELNIEENDLDATTASSFSKPKTTDAPAAGETSKVAKFAKPVAAGRRGSLESSQDDGNASKLSRLRKGVGDSSKVTGRSSLKKGRIVSERMVTSISVEERSNVEDTTKPYVQPTSSVGTVLGEEGSPTTIDSTRIRLPGSRGGKRTKEEEPVSDKNAKTSGHSSRRVINNDSITTFKPKKSYVHQLRNGKTREQSTTEQISPAVPQKSYTVQTANDNVELGKPQTSQEESVIKKPKFTNGFTKSTFRPRYSKRTKQKSIEDSREYQTTVATVTTKQPIATSRYSKKKSIVKSLDGKFKATTTEASVTQTKKHEFRPRTSTYRRHSEVPTTQVESSTKVNGTGVAITPRSPRYHATLKSSTTTSRSVPQVPQVNLKIANDSTLQAGVIDSSNGDSGNTNIFSPTRSSGFLTGNSTLLEQLRSTVAPLLSSLGNKTPVFSGAYSNVNNANSAPRITPSGSPPRFSARYKGAELFVRKQNNVYLPTVPSITSSSTTPATPVENSGSAPPVDVSSPGEPRFLTFYHALESASVRNEQLQGNSSVQRQEQIGRVPQVDSNTTVANGINNNPNSDTTSPTVATTSPQTPDTIANTESSTPAVTTGAPENPSTTEQASTSTETSTNTEQASTSTVPSSNTEQASSTESFSTTEQTSTNADFMSVPEQTSTESLPGNTDAATSSESPGDAQILSRISGTQNSIVETTTAPMNQDLTSSLAPSTVATTDITASTISSNDMQTTDSLATSTQTVTPDTDVTLTTTALNTAETTTVAAVTSDAPNISTSENPDSNTIQQSDMTVTQAADIRSTDAPTTEAVSNNMVDVETTTVIPTVTVRNRLIDFAQDILSHLQNIVTTTVPTQELTTTISPVTEVSNVISDSSVNNTLEILAQFNEVNATVQEDLGTTTSSSGLTTTAEITMQNAVGSVTTSLPTTIQEANTQDEINSVTTTTPAQDSQTVSNIDTTTVGDSNGSSNLPSDVEVTTTSTRSSTNDTLLSELMSIAKTLLSEEINETDQITLLQNSNNTSQLGTLMDNDQPDLSNDTLGTTQATESSSILPDVTTETVETTPTAVSMPDFTTLSIDPSQNEVDSINPTTTGLPSETSSDTPTTTPQNNVVDNEVEVQTTQTTLLGQSFGNVETTTPSIMPANETQVTLSNRISSNLETGLDTTTLSQTTIQSSETTVTPSVNFELTTNTYNLVSSNLVTTTETQTTETITEATVTAITNFTTVTSQPMMGTSTNPPEITTMSTVPDTVPASVNTITTTPATSSELNTEQTTVAPITEFVENVTNGVENATNPTTEYMSQFAPMTTEAVSNETLEETTSTIPTTDVSSMDATEATTNQSLLTSSTVSMPETTTNTPGETTSTPQTTPTLENETPTVIARFQDTTSATAQATADSGSGQTTSMITESSTVPSPDSSTSSMSTIMTTISSAAETTTPTITTMTTETTTGRLPDERTSMPQTTTQSAGMNVVTVTAMSETTATTVDINENLVSTEAPAENMTTISRIGAEETATNDSMSTAGMNQTTTAGTSMPTTTASPSSPTSQTPTTPYLGRFGGSRLTPAPMFSISSTTKAPLRDYLVYGIYPNKTIVRKRPEDNLIDARNVNSPYVIFGIFPDGRLVRKFPNGTIIPDPPRNPVEVVFSLSTSTTTNRPPPRPFYNQANQDTYNQAPVYSNNRRPVAELMRNVQSPSTVDLGLTGNAIVGPNGGGPDFTGPLGTPASAPSTGKMSDALLNTQMGTTSSVMSAIAGLLTPIVSTGRPPTDSQGGRIVQDRERDEATRTKEAGGQRSSVYIGQDKFVNYWTDGVSTASPRVASVKINSVATAANEGPSPSIPSFENLLNNQPGGQVTAPPGFPWRDPLDQIFGITTSSPVITASVSSNTLDDSADTNGQLLPRPINPFVEVFTPFSSAIGIAQNSRASSIPMAATSTTAMPTTTANTVTTTTAASTTTTTTMAPTTTTTTTMAPTTTTTTTMAPTTTTTTTTMAPTTTTTTTTMAPTTTTSTPARPATSANFVSQTTAAPQTTTFAPMTTPFNLPNDSIMRTQQQNAFGRTFDDLVFLNSLLQSNSGGTTPKTLTEVEQLLANKILSLALNDPGPTRAPKAINIGSTLSNSIYQPTAKSSNPIVIDLSPSSTAASPTWKPVEQNSQKPVKSSSVPDQVTWKPVPTSTNRDVEPSVSSSSTVKTTLISTTKASITTTPRPRTTTVRSFGSSLWEALFGNGFFAPSTTQRPVKPKQTKTTPKSVNITPKPIPTTQKPQSTQPAPTTTTLRTVDISKIQVSTPNTFVNKEKSASTSKPISTTKQPLLNNPNPRLPKVATSTFSPEDDAKFLVSLLRAYQDDDKGGASKKSSLSKDDELFLRAILSGQALTTTTPAPSTEISNAALLAALLKAQGIEPPTPATKIREQLQSASLGQSVTSAPTASPATESTTITTRPTSTATRPTDTTKKTVTPRPTSRPRISTTTWSPSSTYPPPLFGSFSNYGTSQQSGGGDNSENGVLFGATRAFSQFLGAAISGAAQQLQSLVRNGTRIVTEAVG